jgi:hypothetical protein
VEARPTGAGARLIGILSGAGTIPRACSMVW